jgi:hypothetical protein
MRAESRLTWAALFCAVISFSITLLLAWKLDEAGAFTQNNVLFKDDSRSGMASFSNGQPAFDTLRHPNIHILVGKPIQVAADLLARAAGVEPDRLRHLLALLVTPVLGAVFVWTMGTVLGSLEIDPITSALLTCLSTASFSHLLFSSMPTHFGISGLMVVVLLALVGQPQTLTWRRWLLWIAAGCIATGVSSFNLVSWTMFYAGALARAGCSIRAVVAKVVMGVATIVSATLTVNLIFGVFSGGDGSVLRSSPVATTQYLRQDGLRRLGQWPDAIVMTLVAGDVTKVRTTPSPWERRAFVLNLVPPPWRAMWVGLSLSLAVIFGFGMMSHLRQTAVVSMG